MPCPAHFISTPPFSRSSNIAIKSFPSCRRPTPNPYQPRSNLISDSFCRPEPNRPAMASEYDQWTTDAAQLDKDFYWGADGQGALTAKSYGLTDSSQLVPQLIKRPSFGSDAYIFSYAGKCYLWNMIADQVFEFTQPTTFDQVVGEMKKPHGTGVTKMKLADQKLS